MMIVFGSGGHTTEMLMLFKNYDFISNCDMVYMVRAESDQGSLPRVKGYFEDHMVKQYDTIIRSRSIPIK